MNKGHTISNIEGLKLNSLFLSSAEQLKNNAADLILKLSMIRENRSVLVDAGVIFSCVNALPGLNDIFVIKTLKILKNIFNEKDVRQAWCSFFFSKKVNLR